MLYFILQIEKHWTTNEVLEMTQEIAACCNMQYISIPEDQILEVVEFISSVL